MLLITARSAGLIWEMWAKFSLTTPQATPGIQRAIDPVREWGYLPIARSLCRASARYVLQTDITNFYPSIYTHVIPWALHSKSVAKQNRNNFNLLGNVLDLIIRNSQDQQTLGIHIGPDCSLVIAEIILSAVDAALLSTGAVNGFRYLDDYEFGFATYSEGEQALADLQGVLSVYELHLNPRKTSLFELPEPIERPWATELSWDNSTLLDMSQSNSMTITIGGLIESNLPFSATQAVSQGRLGNVRYET